MYHRYVCTIKNLKTTEVLVSTRRAEVGRALVSDFYPE